MLIKIALLFLAVMAGLALFGRVRAAKRLNAFCPDCGRPRTAAAPCVCKGGRR